MAIVLDWILRSNNPAVTNIIPDDFNYSYDLLNQSLQISQPPGKTLRYQEREYGINLGWGNEATGDNIRFRKVDGSTTPIMYGEVIALRVNNGKWVKYGHREYGINLVWSDDPVYEWKFIGPTPGAVISMNEVVGLYNTALNDTVQYAEREYGINLR